MSMKSLKKAVSEKPKDNFEMGTVIRWESDAGYNVFLYAAMKTPVGWATTSRTGNNYVPQNLTFDELLEVLGRTEVQDVMVARGDAWEPVSSS